MSDDLKTQTQKLKEMDQFMDNLMAMVVKLPEESNLGMDDLTPELKEKLFQFTKLDDDSANIEQTDEKNDTIM